MINFDDPQLTHKQRPFVIILRIRVALCMLKGAANQR